LAAKVAVNSAVAAEHYRLGQRRSLTPPTTSSDAQRASTERKGFMSASKRQQTMAKIRREQVVRERRALKQERKEAARRAKAGESGPSDAPGDKNDAIDLP
jgi:hypothetical protein